LRKLIEIQKNEFFLRPYWKIFLI